jgi:hypothetical protein
MSTLSFDEIGRVQKLIKNIPPGVYELKKIFGNEWIYVPNPTEYGKIFKKTIEENLIPNVSIGEKKSNNHQTYIINK